MTQQSSWSMRGVTLAAALTLAVAAVTGHRVGAAAEAEPSVSARSAILIEAESEEPVFEQNADERLPMASTTKIMTGLVALSTVPQDRVVEVSPEAVGVEGSSIYLTAGESISMHDLVCAMMLESANDAAAAIAYEVAGGIDEFAAMMNERARELGLSDTHFANPHGLDSPDHYTTARDLARLAAAALRVPAFAEIVSTYKMNIDRDGEIRVLLNHNRLLRSYDSAIGVKTGFTKKSGRCLVSAAERDGITMIAVTLNAPDDWRDHQSMLDYGFSQYERVTVAQPREVFTDLPLIGGVSPTVRCSNADSASVVLPTGAKVTCRIEAARYAPAPVRAGDALAKAVFVSGRKVVAELPLYAEHDVLLRDDKPTFFERLIEFIWGN